MFKTGQRLVSLCVCGSSVFWLVCVGGQQLAVSDADTAPDELEFELVEAPVHGELLKAEGSAHTSMSNGEMITPAFQTQIHPRGTLSQRRNLS